MNTIYFDSIVTLFYMLCVELYFKGFTQQSKVFKFFWYYLASMFVINTLSIFIAKGLHKPNLYLSHFYYISQFVLLSLFYFELLQKKIIKILLIGVLLFVVCQFIVEPNLFFRYNAIGMTLTHFIIVIYAIVYLFKSFQGASTFMYVNLGILFYVLSSTLYFASGNLVLDLDISKEMMFALSNTNRALIIIFQILIFVEWWRHYRVKPSN